METYEKREYLDSELRLFHLPDIPKQESELHYHDFDKVIIFPKGRVNHLTEGRVYPLMPYDIVLVNYNEIYHPGIDQSIPYECIIVYLSPGLITPYETKGYGLGECLQHAKTVHSNVLCACSLEKSSLSQIIQDLGRIYAEKGYTSGLYHQVLFLEFMVQLNHAYLAYRLDYLKIRHSNRKILAIMNYVGAHLSADLNIDALSKAFCISKYHMMRQFKQETGCIVSHHINSKHLLLARELLSGDIPIIQICYDCDLKNYSTLSCIYKSLFGKSSKLQRAARTR